MMNLKKQTHHYTTLARSALVVSSMIAALGWSASATAQRLEFAQKSVGNAQGAVGSTQFRSTIIDPSRLGKTAATSTTLKVIPITDAGNSPKDYSCSICGVVESINITLYEGSGGSDGDEVEDVSRSPVKGKGYVFMTRASENGERYAATQQMRKPATVYEVKVRMSDGTFRIVNEFRQPEYTVGDYVRVISGAVTAA